MRFGETVSYYLISLDMQASELCEKTGLSKSYISKLRSGDVAEPTFDKALKIIDALGVDVDEFVEKQKEG